MSKPPAELHRTLRCIYGDHVVHGKYPNLLGEMVVDGFVCNRHLRLYEDHVDWRTWSIDDDDGV